MGLPEAPDGCEGLFGASWPTITKFAGLLSSQGEARGLIGPAEAARLWDRHIVNCAAVAGFLPKRGTVVDIGSGAGLPGVVVAALRPDLEVELVEPMERRVVWLEELIAALDLKNTRVTRARAEALKGARSADAVTVRAVASMKTLAPWMAGLLGLGGRFAALKGRRASEEVSNATRALARSGLGAVEVIEVRVLQAVEPTWVVTGTRVK